MTIEQIVRWFQDVDIYTFGKEMYGKSESECLSDGYTLSKFNLMRTSPMAWMGSLDSYNQNKLEQLIKSKEVKCN